MPLLIKEHRWAFALIFFVALLRGVLSLHVGLGVDEAHYVLYGQNLALSYFDHPPLVGWSDALFTTIFGVNELGARIGAIIIGVFTSYFVYKLIFDLSHNKKIAFSALLALHASFLFNALFIMLLPDTFLFLLIIPIITTVIKLQNDSSWKNWLTLGFLLGTAGLAKYTAALFIVPILLFYIIKKRVHTLFTFKLFVSALLAAIMILPVIIWNYEHHWISFTYQSDHVVGETHINWQDFFTSIGAQFGAYNPLLFPIAFYGLYKALKSKEETLFLSGLFGLVLISFFSYASLFKPALPHWSALFYLLFIPLGSYFILMDAGKKAKKYLHVSIIFGLLLSSIAYAELGFKFIPQNDYQSLHRDIYGWDKIMKEANAQIHDTNHEAVAVINWTLASRAIYYNLPYKSEVFLLDDRYDQFDLWQKGSPIGKDILIIDSYFFHKELDHYLKCSTITQTKELDIVLNSHKVDTIKFFTCKDYQGLK
jgi:4-amino-4-deoxy-L-arabinose transferase-like glycosyltransferase